MTGERAYLQANQPRVHEGKSKNLRDRFPDSAERVYDPADTQRARMERSLRDDGNFSPPGNRNRGGYHYDY